MTPNVKLVPTYNMREIRTIFGNKEEMHIVLVETFTIDTNGNVVWEES